MKGLTVAVSALLWALSSVLWFAAALQKSPYTAPTDETEGGFSLGEGGIYLDGVKFSARAQHDYHRRQSSLNGWAAGLSAAAAGLAAISLSLPEAS